MRISKMCEILFYLMEMSMEDTIFDALNGTNDDDASKLSGRCYGAWHVRGLRVVCRSGARDVTYVY